MKMKINKVLIDYSKNVIALASLVLWSLTIMASQVRAMQFNKHSILDSTLRQRELELPLPSSWSYSYKHAQGVSLLLNYVLRFTFYVLLLHCCRRQLNNVPWFTPWYIVRRQLGCILPRVPIALQRFLSSQLQPIRTMLCRGYLRCLQWSA